MCSFWGSVVLSFWSFSPDTVIAIMNRPYRSLYMQPKPTEETPSLCNALFYPSQNIKQNRVLPPNVHTVR